MKVSIEELKKVYFSDANTTGITEALKSEKSRLHLKGICGAAASLIIAAVAEKTEKTHLVICSDKEEAAYFFNDLENFPSGKTESVSTVKTAVFFFPSSSRVPYHEEKTDNANVLHRSEVLNAINSARSSCIIVSYPEALSEKVVTKKTLQRNTLSLKRGERISIDFIRDLLFEFHFERVDFVTEPGQFAIRGGIADIFSFSNDFPYRVEFSGEMVESVRSFDAATQLSLQSFDRITIIPNVQGSILQESRETFLEFLPKETTLWLKDTESALEKIEKEFEKACAEFQKIDSPLDHLAPEELYCSKELFAKEMLNFHTMEFGTRFYLGKESATVIQYHHSPQPAFNKNFDLLYDNLLENQRKGYNNILVASNAKQVQRLYAIFDDLQKKTTDNRSASKEKNTIETETNLLGTENINEQNNSLPLENIAYNQLPLLGGGGAAAILLPLHEGFIDHDHKIACYTDHQIFERYHRFRLKEGYQKARQALTLKELTGLQKGDFVTHIDHGIGVFDGLEMVDAGGKPQEAIRIRYKDNDILYVSIHSLHRIAKYSGKEGAVPKINKLGTGVWQALKQKTKKRIKELAFDLVKLYAKRKAQKGFAFAPDSYLQNELEASFIYEDTPDQLKATRDVKKDMEDIAPMDRLVCGDVGFGKTEIAIRAAFKAVTDGKQVAVLAPTTILTLQHYKTFSERLKDFPCTVDYINRFKTAKQQKETLEKLKSGKIDVLIGTHRLIAKDIVFKDLGLLIVDEEQKFGVGAKERLRTIRENVDTLTLTATPIPRTLQFSLMGARDLSVINTPPPNRYPVQTEVHTFNEEVIRDAVAYELSRGGQVFFVHNKIQNIQEVAGMIQRLVPDARIAYAHGQMEGHQLEEAMVRFIEEDYDVLVSTAIIESGLDISNANTIIINDAQNFGLSDLHQLRGRVGRSNKKAFCYLLIPPFSGISDDARKRLNAIEKFSDLGSGFNISMRDLDIRGAGNMLGAEQSGFITEIGYEMYQKILQEAMDELKGAFSPEGGIDNAQEGDGMSEEISPLGGIKGGFPPSGGGGAEVETDFEIMLPSGYVNNVNERISLYKELSEAKTEKELELFRKNLEDRFGPIPQPGIDLMDTIRLRWLGGNAGFDKIVLKNQKMLGYFSNPGELQNAQEKAKFEKLMNFIKTNASRCSLKERGQKLFLSVDKVHNVKEGVSILEKLG